MKSLLEYAKETKELPYQKDFDYNAAKNMTMSLNNKPDGDNIDILPDADNEVIH